MSTSDEHSSTSNYFCHNCGTINTNETICIQCQSEFLEEIPVQPPHTERISDNTQQQLSNDNDDQQVPLIHEFQNLFNNDFDIQSFTNMLLPMPMSQIQPDLPQHRHRRGRPPRRIKRITHRYLPFLDISSFQAGNTPTSQIHLLTTNEVAPRQVLNTQFQPNIPLVQVPLQLFIFDQNRDNLNSEMLTQFLNEDNGSLPVTRDDINQLPTLTSKLYHLVCSNSY